MLGAQRGDQLLSFWRHQHSERQLDELFIFVDGVQGSTHVVGDIGRASLLNPVRKLHDGSLEGELVLIDLEQQGRE